MYHLRPVVTSPNTEGTSHLPKRAAVSTASRAVLLPLGDLVTKQTRRRLLVPTLVNISGDPQTFNSTKHGGGAHQNGLPRQCCAPVPAAMCNCGRRSKPPESTQGAGQFTFNFVLQYSLLLRAQHRSRKTAALPLNRFLRHGIFWSSSKKPLLINALFYSDIYLYTYIYIYILPNKNKMT